MLGSNVDQLIKWHTVGCIPISGALYYKQLSNSFSMRLIEKQMNNAIRCNQNFQKDNTTVINIGTKSFVYLHGNHIATVGSDFLQIFDGGWQSRLSSVRLPPAVKYL